MKSIRKFAYATLLTLSALNLSPSLASAQEAGGRFTLSHEVHWQNMIVPAGEYRFTIEPNGPASMLTLRKVNGKRAGFITLVKDTEESKPTDTSRLEIISRPGGRFVKQMQLPEFGVTLHFVVPEEANELEQAATITTASAAR